MFPIVSDFRNEKIRILYAGHDIFKDKYYGIFRGEEKSVLSIEVISPMFILMRDGCKVYLWTDV